MALFDPGIGILPGAMHGRLKNCKTDILKN
jgi:hypothetical protein